MKQPLTTVGILIVLGALVLLFATVFKSNNDLPIPEGENPVVVNPKLPAGSTPPGSPGFIQGVTFQWIEGMFLPARTPIEFKNPKAFTITFGMDGKVSGTTDCNSFSGDYQVGSDGAITFGPFMSTKMYCDGSQEAEFLNMLAKVARYQGESQMNVLILESEEMMMVLAK